MSHKSGINYTCPDIDKMIKEIKEAIKEAGDGEKETEGDTNERFRAIYYHLSDMEHKLEELRESNHGLRCYGEEQFERAESAESKLEELELKSEQ